MRVWVEVAGAVGAGHTTVTFARLSYTMLTPSIPGVYEPLFKGSVGSQSREEMECQSLMFD